MAHVLVEGSLPTLSSTSSSKAGVLVWRGLPPMHRHEETHLPKGADKGEQTLCGEGDFCLEMRRALLPFPTDTLSCLLARDKCRHPFLICDYTVLMQHRIGQGKGNTMCFHWTLNVNKCTISTKAEVGSSPTLLDSYKHVNKQTGVHTIALLWCMPAQKKKIKID